LWDRLSHNPIHAAPRATLGIGGQRVTIQDLVSRFHVSTDTIHKWVQRGIIPPPHGRTRNARYGHEHVEAIQAHFALKHTSISTTAALEICRQDRITLAQFVKARNDAIKTHGIWDMAF